MELFNPFDLEKWRSLISDFDKKREAFFDNLNALQRMKGATPQLEQERQKLVKDAAPIQKNIERLMSAVQGLRGLLKGIGINIGEQQMNAIPFIAIGISLGAAAVIVASITNWLTKTAQFAERNKLAETLAEAGATPAEIIDAVKVPGQSSAKVLGFDVRWLLAIGAMVIIGPTVWREIEKRI